MSDDAVYDDAFEAMTRRIEIERELASVGVFVVREGEAVLSGRVFSVQACGHRNCRNDSHARLEAPA